MHLPRQAEETDVQLKAASVATTGTAQSVALSASYMLKDVVEIALQSAATRSENRREPEVRGGREMETVRDF
jgi:hypothetical protein